MQTRISRADFEALVRRAGLPLSAAECAELHGAYGHIEAMLERLRTPALPRAVEPATMFRAEEA